MVEPKLQDLDIVHVTLLPISMKIASLAFVRNKDHAPAQVVSVQGYWTIDDKVLVLVIHQPGLWLL